MSDDTKVTFSTGETTPSVEPKRTYTLVFLADLGTDALGQYTEVDKDNFADVMAKAAPGLAVATPDPFGGGGGEWEFALRFDSMKAFEPAGLLAQVPKARARLAIRDKILARRRGEISEAEVEQSFQTAAATDPSLAWLTQSSNASAGGAGASPVAASSGGSILDLVDAPDQSRKISAEVERMAAGAGSPDAKLGSTEITRLDAVFRRIELELTTIADALLKHPDVHRVETVWRGLKFLVDRLDFRGGARLAVVHVTLDTAADTFISQVIDPVFESLRSAPGMVLLDIPVQNIPLHIALLDQLAQHAAGLPVPIAFPMDAEFFGVKSVALIKNLPNLSSLLDGFQFAKWKGLREQRYAKALVPVVGRFILRAPHEARKTAVEFTCAEKITKSGDLCWGGGHLAMGVCAARSFVTHGWPTRMFGAEAGKIDNLPIVPNPLDASRPFGPGDAAMPDSKIGDFADAGLNLLMSVKDKDICFLLGGVSAAKPVVTQEFNKQQAMLEISLPYQQFANIAGDWVCSQQTELRGLDDQTIQQKLLGGLQLLLRLGKDDDAESIMVGVGEHPQQPGQRIVGLRITPPARIVPGGLHLDLSFPV